VRLALSREDRIVKNEALFREVNERIEEMKSGERQSFEIVCECGDRECHQTFEVSFNDYTRVRNQPTHFFVLPGHEVQDVETVIERTTDFDVVEKHVGEERIARLTDPLLPPQA
jgi:uncharacterized protein YifE (UPF0438 family)